MIEQFLSASKEYLRERIWLISDLQQHDPEKSRRCMYTAYEDFKTLGLRCDKIWYLGDSVEGENYDRLIEMTKMQEQVFLEIGAPVFYCPGNHDMDYFRATGIPTLPFRDMVKSHENIGWKTTDKLSDFYFWDSAGGMDVLFLADHADENGNWCFCHGRPFGTGYPYTHEDYRRVAEERDKKPAVISVGHYSYPGGNRAAEYMGEYFPLGENVRLHIYGHAHIGDKTWAGKDWGRQICGTDFHALTQVNISSLEADRGNAIRSAFLELYRDGSIAVLFRNHSFRRWDKLLTIDSF